MTRIAAIEPKDFRQLIEVLDIVFRPDGRASMEHETPQLFVPENFENLRVVYDGDRVVSHFGLLFRDALLYGHRLGIAQVGAVATHPDWRGRGLATQLLEHCMDFARAKGAHLLMISGGRGLYVRNGARSVGCLYRGAIRGEHLGGMDLSSYTVRPLDAADLPRAAFLYQCKPVRFWRPMEDWDIAHRLGKAKAGNGRYLGCYRDGELAAYVVVSHPGKEGKVRVCEQAGLTRAVLAAFNHDLTSGDAKEAHIDLHASDGALLHALRNAGVEFAAGPVEGTIRLVDFVGLMESFRGYFAELAGEAAARDLTFTQDGETFSISAPSGEVEIEGYPAIQEFLFGVGEATHARLAGLDGEFGDVLRTILPLPFPRYDVTYA